MKIYWLLPLSVLIKVTRSLRMHGYRLRVPYLYTYIYISLFTVPWTTGRRNIFLILVIKVWKYFGVYFFAVAFFTPFCPDFKKTNSADFLLWFFHFFFCLYFENNFSCSPLWKIVFQSRKHSWNFIAACFIKKKIYKSQKEKQKEKIRGRQIESSGGKIVERIFAERCNNKSFPRVGVGWLGKTTAGQKPKSGTERESAACRCGDMDYTVHISLWACVGCSFRGRPHKSTQKRTYLFALWSPERSSFFLLFFHFGAGDFWSSGY